MARNKYPEQTIEKILTVSATLFYEQGYDKTTIQDIIDAVGMSKGVIYYHFKSKEEVLDAVIQKQFSETNKMLTDSINSIQATNAKEKLIKIMERLMENTSLETVDSVLLSEVKNPQFIIAGMQEAVRHDAPIFAEIIRDGQKDGSITTERPVECAEIFLLLIDMWCNPMLFARSHSETAERLKFLQKLMRLLGVDIVSDQLVDQILRGYKGGYTNEIK